MVWIDLVISQIPSPSLIHLNALRKILQDTVNSNAEEQYLCRHESRTTTKRCHMWGQRQLKPSCFSSNHTPQFDNYRENAWWITRKRVSQLWRLPKQPHNISEMPHWTGPKYTSSYVKQKINQCLHPLSVFC